MTYEDFYSNERLEFDNLIMSNTEDIYKIWIEEELKSIVVKEEIIKKES